MEISNDIPIGRLQVCLSRAEYLSSFHGVVPALLLAALTWHWGDSVSRSSPDLGTPINLLPLQMIICAVRSATKQAVTDILSSVGYSLTVIIGIKGVSPWQISWGILDSAPLDICLFLPIMA